MLNQIRGELLVHKECCILFRAMLHNNIFLKAEKLKLFIISL